MEATSSTLTASTLLDLCGRGRLVDRQRYPHVANRVVAELDAATERDERVDGGGREAVLRGDDQCGRRVAIGALLDQQRPVVLRKRAVSFAAGRRGHCAHHGQDDDCDEGAKRPYPSHPHK